MNDASKQLLLETAEKLREDLQSFLEKSAYTAPELITPPARQWVATTEALVDLFDAAAASSDALVIEKAVVAAAALTSDYTQVEHLGDLKDTIIDRLKAEGSLD